jgi:pimeloyl-ACP methyl ester carboxylesterase
VKAFERSSLLYYETCTSIREDAEWVLFIHGAGGSTRTWRKQWEVFAQEFHVLAIDLPGHARSADATENQSRYDFEWMSRKLWEVVDKLSIGKIHLVAVSLGSILAMQMQSDRPREVQSMVLAGPIVGLNLKLRLLARAGLTLARVIGFQQFYALTARITLPRKNHKKSREIFVRESKQISDAEYKKWTAMYGKTLDDTLLRLFNKAPSVPVCFVVGDQDHLFKGPALAYAERFKEVTVELVGRCGHLVSLEKSEIFNSLSLRFLLSIPQMLPLP